jgi:hypothetical protein
MRAGDARTFVKPGVGGKPGQSATPCGPGASRRPYRHPIPGGAAGSERTQRSRGPAWPRQVRSSHARAGAYDQPQTCLRGRTHISPATSRILLGTLAAQSASRQDQRRYRAGRRTRSWRGAPQRRRAASGPASLIEQNQPTGVTTRCGLCCSAGLQQRLDDRRVRVHLVQLERAGFRSDLASLPSKRSPAGVAVEVCPLRRCLFVVGLITILKEGACSSRCWSMRSQIPMRR